MSLFDRGPGPLVSVMIPSRKRVAGLTKAIDSCYSLAQDKSLIEFVLKLDADDEESIDAARKLLPIIPLKLIIGPRGGGYADMPQWVDQMCHVATGDWLFLFNDDAVVTTQNWDQILLHGDTAAVWHGKPEICLLVAPTEGRPHNTEWVIMRRETFKLLGHFSGGPHCDSWSWAVMRFVGSAFHCPVRVQHNQTSEDETGREGDVVRQQTGPTFNTIEALEERMADVRKIVDYLKSC